MPKVTTRKKKRAHSHGTAGPSARSGPRQEISVPATPPKRPVPSRGAGSIQGMVMSALVTLGCWGMAISFAFFSADRNHYLFAGMAVLMALIWTFSFGLRVRKVMQQREDRFIASTNGVQRRTR